MATKRPRRPKDTNRLAKLIADMATGDTARDPEARPDTPLVEARRKGGLKGGKARAQRLGAGRRTAIARKAARVRWGGGR